MTCKENSVGAGNRSTDTGRHNQCSASVPTCGTMRFKWDRADLVCGCPHSRSTGCGHKFGSVNPPPCGLHATAIAVARAQPARGVVGGDGNGVGCTASGQEIDELDAFLASEARPQERMGITPSTAFSPRWRSAPIFRFRADGLPVVWGSKSDPVVESAEQAHRIVSLIMRRMNMIVAMLCKAPPAFEPILYEGEVGGETILAAHDWCAGVLAGVKLCIRRLAALGRRIQ
jgi:hypothetical protein